MLFHPTRTPSPWQPSPAPSSLLADSKPPCGPGSNWPAAKSDLEGLRQSTAMPLRAADGRPMEDDTFGSILHRAFRGTVLG